MSLITGDLGILESWDQWFDADGRRKRHAAGSERHAFEYCGGNGAWYATTSPGPRPWMRTAYAEAARKPAPATLVECIETAGRSRPSAVFRRECWAPCTASVQRGGTVTLADVIATDWLIVFGDGKRVSPNGTVAG